MPKGKHTAGQIADRKRQGIVLGLSNGESKRSISRRLRTSEHIVDIVLNEEWEQVAARKQILAAQAEQNAMAAGEQIAEALSKRQYSPSALVPVYGVSLDKAVLLRNDPQQINVTHQIEPGPNLYAKLEQLATRLNKKSAQGSEVEVGEAPTDSRREPEQKSLTYPLEAAYPATVIPETGQSNQVEPE